MRKLMGYLLCFSFLIQIVSLGTFTAHGTEADAVYISTKEELIRFSEEMENEKYKGKTVYLKNDIVFNEGDLASMSEEELGRLTPWEDTAERDGFKGTFDGQGYTISGIYFRPEKAVSTGLFGNTKSGATIKNLKIVNSLVVARKAYSGGLFGSVKGDVTLSNLYIDVDLRTEYNYCGGLVGYFSTNTLNMDSCVYAGTIEASASAGDIGGLVGYHGSGTVNVLNCAFDGAIKGEATNVGGLLGHSYVSTLSITNSISMGHISSSQSSVASFVGYSKAEIQLTNNLYTGTYPPTAEGSFASSDSSPCVTQVTAEELTGGEAMSTLARFGYTAWKACAGRSVLPVTVAGMIEDTESPMPTASTKFVGYQIGVGEKEGTLNLRLVAVVDSAQYEAVGFSVVLQNDIMGTKSRNTPTNTVYQTLTGYGAEQERVDYTAESLGGKYIFALNIKNIPVSHGNYEFAVSTYHMIGGEVIPDGEAKVFTLEASKWEAR